VLLQNVVASVAPSSYTSAAALGLAGEEKSLEQAVRKNPTKISDQKPHFVRVQTLW